MNNIVLGQKFGKLTVIRYALEKKYRRNNSTCTFYECLCECGNIKYVRPYSLIHGHTRSCGCNKTQWYNRESNNYRDDTALRYLYIAYQQNAKNRNLEFNLNIEEFTQLTKQNCYYCGNSPSSIKIVKRKNNPNLEGLRYIYNGIDRVDNNLGYILENCVSCCETCNRAKLQMSVKEFLIWVEKIHSRWINNVCKGS